MSHSLDINHYAFGELLELFDLDNENITIDELKRAKRRVLMTHPDKSKLPPEYFLFYKKAFEIIVRMYENVEKVSKKVEDQEYVADQSDLSNKEFRKNIQKIPQKDFHKTFHENFEKHAQKKIDTSKNDWFRNEESMYSDLAQNANQMGASFDRIKERQQQMIIHKEIAPMRHSSGNSYYDDDDNGEYVQCDPFSKLKFDDLRKVHKDETIFSTRESDMNNIQTFRSVDDYQRARDVTQVRPMERTNAERMMQEQEKLLHDKMREKQYSSELNVMRNTEMNKKVMANFLRIGGG